MKRRLEPTWSPSHAYDLSTLAAALENEQHELAFRAALGTVAPTYWISPSTYEVALERLVALRPAPESVDPDVVEVFEAVDRRIVIEFKWRTWAEAAAQRVVEVMLGGDPLPRRGWQSPGEGIITVGQVGIMGYVTGGLPPVTGAEPGERVADVVAAQERELAVAPPPSALIAREVRDLSGLTARQLGDVFPVARENFQRWISGAITPSDENLQRLLSLRHFFRTLADRVDDPKVWLFSPLEEATGEATAYSLLVRGDLASLWDAIVALPSRTASENVIDSEGDRGVRITTSLRGAEAATPESELDEYAEWFDDE